MKRLLFFLLALLPLASSGQSIINQGAAGSNVNWLNNIGFKGYMKLPVISGSPGAIAGTYRLGLNGLMVYDSTNKITYVNNGSTWVAVGSGGGASVVVLDSVQQFYTTSGSTGALAYVKDQKRTSGNAFIWKSSGVADTGMVYPCPNGVWEMQRSQPYVSICWYGAKGDGVTDDTRAIQKAIWKADTNINIAKVFVPWSGNTYIIGGPLIDSLNGVYVNCQLYFPLHQQSTTMTSIVLEGEAPPNFSTEAIANTPRNHEGCIFESTITGTGTAPSVIGTSYYNAGVTGLRNFFLCRISNLIIRTNTKSGATNIAGTMWGINFAKGLQLRTDHVKVDISSDLTSSVLPTNGTCGIVYPDEGNQALLGGDEVMVEGYEKGVVPGEHAEFGRLVAVGCVKGIYLTNAYHAIHVAHYNCEGSNISVEQNGRCAMLIDEYDTEHYLTGPEWYVFQKDFNYVGGVGGIYITLSRVTISGVGNADSFITNDALGDHHKILWGAGANTFASESGGGSISYIAKDAFTRVDNSSTLGNLDQPSSTAWSPEVGTWGITSNKAYCVSESSSGSVVANKAMFESGVSDFTLETEVTLLGASAEGGIIFRGADKDNCVFLDISDGNFVLYEYVSGSPIQQSSIVPVASNVSASPFTIKIVCNGTSIKVYRNGALLIDILIPEYVSQTKMGYIVVSGTGFGGGMRFDNLKVY